MEWVVISNFYCTLMLFADLNILQMSHPVKNFFKNKSVDGCYFGIKQFINFSQYLLLTEFYYPHLFLYYHIFTFFTARLEWVQFYTSSCVTFYPKRF